METNSSVTNSPEQGKRIILSQREIAIRFLRFRLVVALAVGNGRQLAWLKRELLRVIEAR